jgi:hypothetical protein
MAGRKSFHAELRLFERYNELTVPYFNFLKRMLKSKSKEDKKWASERIEKAFVKMIPQDVTSGGEKIQPIYAGISKHLGDQEDIQPEEKD